MVHSASCVQRVPQLRKRKSVGQNYIIFQFICVIYSNKLRYRLCYVDMFGGADAGALVQWSKHACLQSRRSRLRTSLWPSKIKKNVFPRSLVKIKYCGEPPWPRGSALGLRPPGLKFLILCLEGSVISPSSGCSPGPVQPICAQMCPFLKSRCSILRTYLITTHWDSRGCSERTSCTCSFE